MKKINVIYVEDNPGDVRLIKELLTFDDSEKYMFFTADQLGKIEINTDTRKYDIILLDLNLPDSIGINTLKKIQVLIPDTPIIVLTGSSDENLSEEIIKSGAQDFINKNSITKELLLHSIRYAIDRQFFLKEITKTHFQFIKLIENNSDSIIVINKLGTIKYINPASEKLFSRTKEELINQNFGFPISLNEHTEIEILGKGGIFKIAEMRISEIEWDGEKSYLAALRDITIRKQIEKQNIEYGKKLKEANLNKDKFFSIIAHDLKSPFNGLLGLTELILELSEDISKSELVNYVGKLNSSAKNLFQLLGNLLDWALLQKDTIKIESSHFNLLNLAEQNIKIISEKARQKEITIKNKIENSYFVYADEKMIATAFRNLLANAVKFTNRGGSVTIKSKQVSDKMVQISVKDNGIGMPPDKIEKLFKIGEDVGTKGTDGELSTGLGLILCKEFVEKNGGKIWAKSEEGKGSAFFFTVPLDTVH